MNGGVRALSIFHKITIQDALFGGLKSPKRENSNNITQLHTSAVSQNDSGSIAYNASNSTHGLLKPGERCYALLSFPFLFCFGPSSGLSAFLSALLCVAFIRPSSPFLRPSVRPSPFIQFSVSHSVSLLAAGRHTCRSFCRAPPPSALFLGLPFIALPHSLLLAPRRPSSRHRLRLSFPPLTASGVYQRAVGF